MHPVQIPYVRIEPRASLKAVAVIPDFHLPTEQARGILPEHYSRVDAIHSLSHASLLAAALATGNYALLAEAMQDKLHQPYRTSLVPGLSKLLSGAKDYGALGAALSGAGPTVLALLEGEEERLKRFFQDTLLAEGITSQVLTLAPDNSGVQISEHIDTPF
jgi:homoserine kinase